MNAPIKNFTQSERHSRNADIIVKAGPTTITMKIDGVPSRPFGAYTTKDEIRKWLEENQSAVPEKEGGPLIGFTLKADLPKPTQSAQPGPEPRSEKKSTKSKEAPATESPPLPPMKRVQKPPARIRSTETINEFIGPNGGILWPDLKKSWNGTFVPKASCANARVAILALGIDCSHDLFHGKFLVGGHAVEQWSGELSDHACQMLRVLVQKTFDFDPGRENMHDAVVQLCLQSPFDPVLDYLDGLSWDGKRRLDSWLIDYLGAEKTELNRVIGRLALVAAVRRARQPGCKFDQIIVLEGKEGRDKSTAIETMAGEENFSDQGILGLDEKRHAELLKGKWLYEIADLTGLRRSEVEAVKAFASRKTDRARPAYGRYVVDQHRRCVIFATTNDDAYLKSQTGNRRFWPVKTARVVIDALRRDRDQLWAEAAKAEAAGESIRLPERFWALATAEQNKRLEHDPWDDILGDVKGEIWSTLQGGEERVASSDLLFVHLKIPPERATKEAEKRLAKCMQRLGWDGPDKMRIVGKPQRGYRRLATEVATGEGGTADVKQAPWRQ